MNVCMVFDFVLFMLLVLLVKVVCLGVVNIVVCNEGSVWLFGLGFVINLEGLVVMNNYVVECV